MKCDKVEIRSNVEDIVFCVFFIFDLIISDIMMFVMDGLEFLEIIKKNDIFCYIFMVMLIVW